MGEKLITVSVLLRKVPGIGQAQAECLMEQALRWDQVQESTSNQTTLDHIMTKLQIVDFRVQRAQEVLDNMGNLPLGAAPNIRRVPYLDALQKENADLIMSSPRSQCTSTTVNLDLVDTLEAAIKAVRSDGSDDGLSVQKENPIFTAV
mmetsp:Transcript_22587/g.41185  ORF Transcript_22587/g.41185 Transcript_22587/m.41185 type:complete len:148 (+) Transcript_22587:3-446(+)